VSGLDPVLNSSDHTSFLTLSGAFVIGVVDLMELTGYGIGALPDTFF
jgi:hypothetical protein